MKKSFYLFALFLAFTFIASPAMAETDLPCNGTDPYSSCSTSCGTALPINSGIVYLCIAALIMGIVAIRKYSSTAVKA